MELLGMYLVEPSTKSDKVYTVKQYCKCPTECVLKQAGKCMHSPSYLGRTCVYGSTDRNTGPTRRANKYYGFVKDAKLQIEDAPSRPKYTVLNCLEIIGEYVYLPYSFMDMCEGIKFYQKARLLFGGGMPFIKTEEFTPEVVVRLANFRPMALMGGEITDYQKEQVPLFLSHLNIKFPELYQQAVALDPKIADKVKNLDEVKVIEATLDSIPAGVVEGYTLGKHALKPLHWDGKTITISAPNTASFGLFLESYSGTNATMTFEPNVKETKVWITDKELIKLAVLNNPDLLKTK